MISVPIAVHIPHFEWQLSLFWHNHVRLYGKQAKSRAIAAVIKRNSRAQKKQESFGWDIDVPHKMCESYFDCGLGLPEEGSLLPMNIQAGLMQVLADVQDNEVIELLDCDMFHLRMAPDFKPRDNELIVTDVYEKWHLQSLGNNRHAIDKYVGPSSLYYNGGFVPIVGRAGTFKKIMLDWVWIHKDIVSRFRGEHMRLIRWWGGMFALQAACEVNKIKMRAMDICHVPNINKIENSHYIAHYSVDPNFDKKRFPHVDTNKFQKNMFYRAVQDWMQKRKPTEASAKQSSPKTKMDMDKFVSLYKKYLRREPSQNDIQHHIHKDPDTFESELKVCPERRAILQRESQSPLWAAHEKDGKPLEEHRVKIAVGSNKAFCGKTLPVVLGSLKSAGVSSDSIVVFNAGFSKRRSYVKEGVLHVELDHNSFENSAFVDIVENEAELRSDFWFFMHDTCKVGPQFKSLMLDVPNGAPKVALRSWPSMSIGLYSHDYIMRCRDRILKVKNKDYSADALMREKLWGIPNEDYILWLEHPGETLVYRNFERRIVDSENWFGGDSKRITEYYPHLDLYKNKSDWATYQGRNLNL